MPIAARRTRRSLEVNAPSLKAGLAEQVRRRHADAQAGLLQRRLEARDDAVALGGRGAVRDEVLVVQADAPGAQLGELAHRVDGVERFARRTAEGVATGVPDRPEPEREAVLRARREVSVCDGHVETRIAD